MKYISYGIISCAIIVLIVIAILTIETKAARETELSDALPDAVETALDETAMKGTYSYSDKEGFISDFTSVLLSQLNVKGAASDDLNITVDVAGADEKRHLLSVHVKADYVHPNGKKGSTEIIRTAILDSEYQKKIFKVSYYYYNPDTYPKENYKYWTNMDGSIRKDALYYTFDVVEGESLPLPSAPKDVLFKAKKLPSVNWTDMDTNTSLNKNIKVERNMRFVAYPDHE